MFKSIKLNLVIWFLIIFSVVFTVLEVFLYYELETIIISKTDDHLKTTVDTIASLLQVEDSQGHFEMELIELTVSASGDFAQKLSGQYYQVVDADGTIIARSPSLGLAGEQLPVVTNVMTPKYETILGPDNTPIRLISASYQFSRGWVTLQAGDTLEDINVLLSSFRRIVIISYPVIFLLCGTGTFLITGFALRPIRQFADRIDRISETELSTKINEEDAPNELAGLAGSFNKMMKRLELSFNKQRQFLSDASHELRTPTSIIKSYCDVTLRRDRTTDEYRDVLGKVGDAVNRMCTIIERILTISRLDNKVIEFRTAKVDIKEIIDDVVKLVEQAARSKDVAITSSGNKVLIKGDREGLTEVFSNVVENAIKYNRQGGSINISIGDVNDNAIVSISDTGIGIPKEEIDKIFDRFYRVDASRGQTVGSGLGLSIVRAIVESHGGRIEVESTFGKGSTFRIILPKEYKNNN